MARLGMDRTGNKRISTLQYFLQNDYKRNRHLYEVDPTNKCEIYRLGSGMTWDDFMDMPDDLKYTYIRDIRKKFNTPDEELADAFKISHEELNTQIHHLDLSVRDSDVDYDRERFISWWNGNGR